MKYARIGFLVFATFLGLSVSTGEGWADIKVQTLSPCQKIYRKMAKRIKQVGATHYAVATTGGRGLGEQNTGCGFDSGFGTKALLEKSALNQCAITKKDNGYPGTCRVVESK